VSSVEGAGDLDAPLVTTYEVRWNDYATVTKHRILFSPIVFGSKGPALFPQASRHNDIYFSYPITCIDNFTLRLPAGCKLEVPSVPDGMSGTSLSVDYDIGYMPKSNKLKVRRTYVSKLGGVPVQEYPKLKKWYDNLTELDRHQLILIRPAEAKAAPAAAPESATAAEPATDTTRE
jgi:hypothetical protein